MSALTQYIELYQQNSKTINENSSAFMNAKRDEALKILNSCQRLPKKGDEGYESFSLEDAFAPDYGVNINRVAFSADVASSFKCDVPNISTLLGAVINDSFVESQTLKKNMPEGVKICPFGHAQELAEKYYGTLAPISRPEVALNTLLAQTGLLIYVGRGVHVNRPVQIVNILNAAAQLMAVRRVLIVMDEDSSAQILACDHTQNSQYRYLASQVVEIVMKRGSQLDFYDLEESSALTTRVSGVFVDQEEGSSLTINGSSLVAGTTRNDYIIDLNGEHCNTSLGGMVIGTADQLTDNSTLVRHHVPRCHSTQLFKYVLDDNSRGAFEGTIVVDTDAIFTEAYQSNRNLLASGNARMHTKPQLEIYCDEVKCSHGATTGQLDANAMFYMQARGIPEKEARHLLMQAFMADAIDSVKIEALRDRLRHLVEKRLLGEQALCGDCAASCH
jgi:Fe-S cluster assembly protein SufD